MGINFPHLFVKVCVIQGEDPELPSASLKVPWLQRKILYCYSMGFLSVIPEKC